MNFVHIRLHEGDKRAGEQNSFLTQGIITAKRASAKVIVPALRAVANALTPTVFAISLVSTAMITENADAKRNAKPTSFDRRLRELESDTPSGKAKSVETTTPAPEVELRTTSDSEEVSTEKKIEILKSIEIEGELPVPITNPRAIKRFKVKLNKLIDAGYIKDENGRKPNKVKENGKRKDKEFKRVLLLWQTVLRDLIDEGYLINNIKSSDPALEGKDGDIGTTTMVATNEFVIKKKKELTENKKPSPPVKDLGPELAAKDKKINELEGEVQKLKDRITDLEEQLKTAGTSDEANQLRQKVEELQQELQRCKDDLNTCQAESGRSEELKRKVEELEAEVERLTQEVDRLKQELERTGQSRIGKPADLNPPTAIAVNAYRDGHPSTYLILGGDYHKLELELPTLNRDSTQRVEQQTVNASLVMPFWKTVAIVGAFSDTRDKLQLTLGNDDFAAEVEKQFVGGGLRATLSNNRWGTSAFELVLGASFNKEFPVIVNGTRLVAKGDSSPDGIFKLVLTSPKGKTFLAGKLSSIGYNPSEVGFQDKHMPSLPWVADSVNTIIRLDFETQLVLLQQVPAGINASYGKQHDGRIYSLNSRLRVPFIGNNDFNFAALFGGNYQNIREPTDDHMDAGGFELGVACTINSMVDLVFMHNWRQGDYSLGENEYLLSAGLNLGGIFTGSTDLSGFGTSNSRNRINGALVIPK